VPVVGPFVDAAPFGGDGQDQQLPELVVEVRLEAHELAHGRDAVERAWAVGERLEHVVDATRS
jgi:hypothetical protein